MEPDFEEPLKAVSKWTTEKVFIISKKFESKVAQILEKIFAHFNYEVAEVSCVLKTTVSDTTPGAQREIVNWVALLSNRLGSRREAGSVKPTSSVLSVIAATASTAPSTSAGRSLVHGP